jgi:hypothetical protein
MSLGILWERKRITQRIIGQPREALVQPQALTQYDGKRSETDTEQIVEEFRTSHSETRTYFTHTSIAVRVPHPKDWVTYIEQNDEKEFRVRFYPRASDSFGYAFRRVPRANEETLHGIRNADVMRVMRSGMAMDRVRMPPQRNPFDESSTPLAWWVTYEWHDEAWQYALDGAEDDLIFEAAAMLLKFPDTVVPTRDTGVIEGSLSYPSEVVMPQEVCAVEVSTNQRFCTNEQLYDDMRYAHDVGYRLQVPPGTYVVSSSNRGYEARYLGCSISESEQCTSHAAVPVVVSAGATVSGIDPQEWWGQTNDDR